MTGNYLKQLYDFILPRTCFHCGKILSASEQVLCSLCFSTIQPTNQNLLNYEFKRKFASDKFVDDFFSAFIFEKEEALQSILHNIKYSNQFYIGTVLGKWIYEQGCNIIESWNAKTVIPIPLHRLKKAERGYNQSYRIAKGLSKELQIKIIQPLKRVVYTSTQTTLSANERKANIAGAFKIKKGVHLPDALILLDDVITTGSTINEAAKVLKQAGVNKVYAVSLAIPALE